jgi:hypothetical protein
MTKLYLHIGTHKTGSTALQYFLTNSEKVLAAHNLVYPDIGRQGDGHHQLAWSMTRQNEQYCPQSVDKFLARLRKLGSDQGRDIILSSEDFSLATDVAPLAALKDDFELYIVVYLRRQDHYLQALYNQHVRMHGIRFSGSIYEFQFKLNVVQRMSYRKILARWEALAGRDKLIVRPYGTALVNSDICHDFFEQIQCTFPAGHALDIPPVVANRSASASLLCHLSHLNRITLTEQQHKKAEALLRDMLPPAPDQQLLRLSDAKNFYSKFQNGNRYVFERYMGLDSDPFESLDDNTGAAWANYEQVDIRLLMDVIDQVIN